MTDIGCSTPTGGTTIARGVSIREAARRLGITPDRARGQADGMEVALARRGRALVMSEADFRRMKQAVESRRARERVALV